MDMTSAALDPQLRMQAEKTWNETVYSRSRIQVLPSTTSYEIRIPINLLVLRPTNFTLKDISEIFTQVEAVYAQCEISFGPITLIEAHSSNPEPSHYLHFDWNYFPVNTLNSPTVLFRNTGNSHSWPAFSKRENKPEVPNTAVVSHLDFIDDRTRPANLPQFSTTAHELAHLFLNESHNDFEANVLNGDWYSMGLKFTRDQCEKMRFNFRWGQFNLPQRGNY